MKRAWTTIAFAGALGASCTAPGGPDNITHPQFGPGSTTDVETPPIDGGIVVPQAMPLTCAPAVSSQPLPARSTIASGMPAMTSASTTYLVSDLFEGFRSVCGGCHVDSSLGDPGMPFHVTAQNFAMVVDKSVLDRIIVEDPNTSMPPQSPSDPYIPFSKRSATDPIVQLATLLGAWIQQDRPSSAFTIMSDSGSATASADYSLTPTLGAALTNIGSCVPAGTVGQNQQTMDALDDFFASAMQLPQTLAETDLTTLDSMALAQNGVISYAPTYPLYSDGSGKMRYVRVPRGESIVFDKTTQSFKIPENTRFYKTFLKEIVDADGNDTYRKIETRIIVARADTDPAPGTSGETEQNALFGTYVWNEDESNAVLLQDPLRNGKPFRDRAITYFTDEGKAQAIIDQAPADLEGALAEVPGLARHYALPGSERCVDCHMGSPSADFILGFTPLQVNRRSGQVGTEGLFEEATSDELTQLQRLIDYRVVTGMTSPTDVVPLEKSEGTRAPRNDSELLAQGYMVGNCAHCHNPRGFPTKKAPVLKDFLNFLPSAEGGIFQFPLDRTSPVRSRGPNQDVPIPYVTPSLYDYPVAKPPPKTQKGIDCAATDPRDLCFVPDHIFILAPWRSLIYRNVDTPFDYVEDSTIFPHMPMNSAGFDCRAPRIMGDWMTSIPAVIANPKTSERVYYVANNPSNPTQSNRFIPSNPNFDSQPYVEVKPGDPGYEGAVGDAANRNMLYHLGHRYDYCPDTTDILDPFIVNEENENLAVTADNQDVPDPQNGLKILWPYIGVPMRPHLVVTDTTDPPGAWNPRRPDWAPELLQGMTGDTTGLQPDDLTTLQNVIAALQTAKLTPDINAALTQKLPMGLWKQKSGCGFAGIPTISSYTGDARPLWMDVPNPMDNSLPAPGAPVYEQTLGGQVFSTICFNCHGPQADAAGLLADEISLMTGGDARVANFRDGLLGPRAMPGMNRTTIFADPAHALGADDISARYVAWMALGGTLKHLPQQLLDLVSNTPVFGLFRNRSHFSPRGTPDMLELGLDLCTDLLPANLNAEAIDLESFFASGHVNWAVQTALIDRSGDAELWLRLCSLGNRPVVRVPQVAWKPTLTTKEVVVYGNTSLYWGDGDASGPSYPSTAPVMNHRGKIVNGVDGNNLFPICIRKPDDPQVAALADQFLQAHLVGGAGGAVIPYCPPQLFAHDDSGQNEKFLLSASFDNGSWNYVDAKKWAARGAVNAGMAVFVYLDQLERGQVKVIPSYDQCESLPTSSTP